MTTLAREPEIEVAISFDGTGEFDESIDDLSDRLLVGTLSVSSGEAHALPTTSPKAPDFGWESQNEDQQLSNFLASSARYRLVKPGKPARVRFGAGTAGYTDALPYAGGWFYEGHATVPVATGTTRKPAQRTTPGERSVTFTAVGQMALLSDNPISTPLYTNIRTDQAIAHILDAVGWPAALRELSVGDTTLAFWWLDDEDPLNAIVALLYTEGIPSLVFERGDGALVFRNRNYLTTADASVDVQCTFYDRFTGGTVGYADDVDYAGSWPYGESIGQILYEANVEDDPAYEDLYNAAAMTVRRRVVGAAQKVWEYGETLTLGANETRDIKVTVSDPCSSFTAPVAATDYTVSVGSLASTPTLLDQNAQRLTVRFVAGAGGATVLGVTSNGPQLRGTPATVVREIPVTHSIDTSETDVPSGVTRVFAVAARQEIGESTGITLCDAAVAHHLLQRSRIRLTVENIDANHLIRQLVLEPGNRIGLRSTQLGYGVAGELGEFWLSHKDLRREPGKLVCTLSCQQVLPEAGGALWDDGLWNDGLWAR